MDISTTALIRQIAVGGNELATNRLMHIIHEHHLNREIRRFRGRNRLVDEADIESEFMLGCYKALARVDPDKGNPLLYILWKGKLAVLTLFKSKITKGTRARCLSCGRESRMGYRRVPRCLSCGSGDLQTWQVEVPDSQLADESGGATERPPSYLPLDDLDVERDLWFNRNTYQVQIGELRARLSGRSLQLFEILIDEGLGGTSSKNYLKEIAGRWGVTAPSVCAALRRLRAEVLRYYELDEA